MFVDLDNLTNEERREQVGEPCEHYNRTSEVYAAEDRPNLIITECHDCGLVF